MAIEIIHGKCELVLPTLEADSFHACVTDPPYHLTTGKNGGTGVASLNVNSPAGRARIGTGFMGKAWDGGDVAFRPETWAAVLRMLKPGAYLVAFSGTRNYHRMVCAIEDAGFEIRDCISHLYDGGLDGPLLWTYGSGFPKSLNVSRSLLALPWCACGSCEETLAGTVSAVPSDENAATLSADADVASGSPRAGFIGQPGESARSPAQSLSATVRAALVPSPFDGSAADRTSRLSDQSRGRSRHGQATVEAEIKDGQRHLDPVMFGTANVAAVAQRHEVAHGIGSVQVEPETLRNDMMGNEPVGSTAVRTALVSGDDGTSGLPPRSSFVRPSAAAPSGVGSTIKSIGVVQSHTATTAIDGIAAIRSQPASELDAASDADETRRAALELDATRPAEKAGLDSSRACEATVLCSSEPSHELDAAILTGFDRHESIICSLIAEGKISICAACKRPQRPSWIMDGLGTALKPACELICVARKPLSEGTVAANVLRHGTGALNIDASRVACGNGDKGDWPITDRPAARGSMAGPMSAIATNQANGRWPANVCHDGSPEVMDAFARSGDVGGGFGVNGTKSFGLINDDGWQPKLVGQTVGFGDAGSAARFYFCAKADASERVGSHPTVKPVALMEWLVRVVTPPGGRVLDPFCGTGSTLVACEQLGFDGVGIELSEEYVEDAKRKLAIFRARRMIGLAQPLGPVDPRQGSLL